MGNSEWKIVNGEWLIGNGFSAYGLRLTAYVNGKWEMENTVIARSETTRQSQKSPSLRATGGSAAIPFKGATLWDCTACSERSEGIFFIPRNDRGAMFAMIGGCVIPLLN